MEALISQGASVTVKDNVTKRTPLHASGERALMLHLWYKPYNTEAFTFTYLLSLCTFLLNGRRRFWHVLRTAACLLRSYSEPFIFHFLGLFSSVPMVQSSLTQNPVFFHTTASLPLPACLYFTLPLYYHLLFKMCYVSSMTPLNGSSAKKSGEERTLASLLLLQKKRLKIQVGFDWWCNYPGVQNFRPFAVATLEKFTRFRHYPPPELACELALAGSLLHSSCVEC